MSTETVILPIKGEENILITSALPYANNVPHLGNIVGSVLSADVFSRYNRIRGRTTLFICGTDEYGTATETKALQEKISPEELCAKYHKQHAEIYKWFNIKFDKFGRTSTPQQTVITQQLFRRVAENDFVTQLDSQQPYCSEANHGFLADRFIEGICPKCEYEDARGDQCDRCGSVDYEALDLKEARCKIHSTAKLTPRETRHIYLQLAKLQPEIEKWFTHSLGSGLWARNGQIITESWLKQGLRDRGITRDFKWGVPVPLDIFQTETERKIYQDKVFYVWFDACIGYVSITANYTSEWERWWRDPENVKLFQFMGKDNVPFHSVVFPATQLGSRDQWTMVHALSSTEYLNYEDGKFSKSRGVGVFGDNARDTGVAPDVWRYYLLKHRPETADTQFDWRDFIAHNNNELLAKLGNFVNRIIKLVNSKLYNSIVPDYRHAFEDPRFSGTKVEVRAIIQQYIERMEAIRLKDGLQTAMDLAQVGNNLIQSNKLDNKLATNEPEIAAAVVGLSINIIYLCSSLFEPYLPDTASSILDQLDAPSLKLTGNWDGTEIKPGHKVRKAKYLFNMIDPSKEAEWREAYGGTQEGRAKKLEEAQLKKRQKEADKARKAARKAAAAKPVETDVHIHPQGPPYKKIAPATASEQPQKPVDLITDKLGNLSLPKAPDT